MRWRYARNGGIFAVIVVGSAWLTHALASNYVPAPALPATPPARTIIYNPDNPCGPVSVEILLQLIITESPSSQQCRDAVHCDSLGLSSVNDLLIGLRQLGYAAEAVSVSDLDRVQHKNVGPVIAHMLQEHFVTIMVTPNGTVISMDASGAKVVPIENFTTQWSGVCIICKPTVPELQKTLSSLGLNTSH